MEKTAPVAALSDEDLGERSLRALRLWGGSLFFFSGLTGLIYQILWTRRLNLTFGHSILAVSTVVTAYMGGLALGSWLGGRWSDQHLKASQRASWFLSRYGWLEAFVGLWALLSLPLLLGVETFYLEMSARGYQGFQLYLMAFSGSTLVLLPPTTAMGATLPLVSCLYNNHPAGLGSTLSRLYATNTFGALVGVAVAGFLLLPVLGLKVSLLLAALLNLLIGFLAVTISRRLQGRLQGEVLRERPRVSQSSWILPLGFGLTGGLSMAYQVGWTRSLSLSLGCSVYAFSSILVVFLGGIALGSALYGRWRQSARPTWQHLSWIFAGVGASGALAVILLGYLPLAFLRLFPYVNKNYWQVLLADLLLSGLVLFLPTLLMGLSFPMVTQLYHNLQSSALGTSVGNIYSANTLGCILGSFGAGFVLIPQLGVQATLLLATCGFFWVAALYAAQHPGPKSRAWVALWLVLGPAGWLLPGWDSALLSAGVATHGSSVRDHRSISPHQPIYYRDGISGSVAVLLWAPGGLTLRVNGKPEASLGKADRINQTLLGLLPHLHVSDPRRVGVIGLGSGLTLRALAESSKVEEALCAELEPYVIEADRFWAPYNGQILSDPRVKALYADGRTMVMGSPRPFDALVSVPSNPWIAGIGNLFTVDFYQSVRAKLREGGTFVQWVNLYSLSPEDLALVLRSFGQAFPEAQLWVAGGDLAMIGGQTRVSLEGIRAYYKENPELARELADLGFANVEQLLGSYICPLEFALAEIPAGPVNTDDKPILEYSAPFSMYNLDSYGLNLERVYRLREAYDRPPPGLELTPHLDTMATLGSMAFPQLLTPRYPKLSSVEPPILELVEVMRRRGDLSAAAHQARLEWVRRFPVWEGARAILAQNADMFGLTQQAVDFLPNDLDRLDRTRRYFWLLIQAASQLQAGDWKQAAVSYGQLAEIQASPDFDSALAFCRAQLEDWEQAHKLSLEALEHNPYDPRAHFVQALGQQQRGDLAAALETLARVCRDCPNMREPWLLRARLLAKSGRSRELRQVLTEYLKFYPDDPQMRGLLQQL